MKKTLIALSFVCAGALAFADNPQYNDGWFSGIGTGATSIEALEASNGAWLNLTADNASVAEGALVLDLDKTDAGEAEEATFAVADTASAMAADAFPVQRIVVSGVFTPIAAEDLLKGTVMSSKKAKVGFAIVNVGGEADSYKYYAWVGGVSEAESASAIDDWVVLGDVADEKKAQTIVIDLDYSTANAVTAKFAVGDDEATAATLKEGGVALTGAALTAAQTDKVIASVSCTGSGTLSALQGKYQYAVAEVDGVKYATVDAAVKAAEESSDGTVTVVRNLKEGDTVAAANGVTIEAGTGVTLSKEQVTSADTSKEVVEVNGVVTVRTTKDILDAVTVGTAAKSLTAGSQEADAKVAKFRDFLNRHCGKAYRQANTTADAIKEALEVVSSSGRTLWQSYALGVEPEATLKLAQVTKDDATDGITLKFPGTPTDDFTIKYTVTDGTEAGTMTVTDATAVKVPLKTGHYAVKISFE